jgi:DNA-binding phage protein
MARKNGKVKNAKPSVPRTGRPPRMRVVGFEGKEQRPNEFGIADATYFRELHGIVDRVFAEADSRFEWTWSQLATEAGLAYQTVANLGDRKTRWPQFRTVWRICKAVGWDLVEKKRPKSQRTTLALKAG